MYDHTHLLCLGKEACKEEGVGSAQHVGGCARARDQRRPRMRRVPQLAAVCVQQLTEHLVLLTHPAHVGGRGQHMWRIGGQGGPRKASFLLHAVVQQRQQRLVAMALSCTCNRTCIAHVALERHTEEKRFLCGPVVLSRASSTTRRASTHVSKHGHTHKRSRDVLFV